MTEWQIGIFGALGTIAVILLWQIEHRLTQISQRLAVAPLYDDHAIVRELTEINQLLESRLPESPAFDPDLV